MRARSGQEGSAAGGAVLRARAIVNRKQREILVNMKDFINGTEVRMPRSRGRLDEKLTAAEITEFRSSVGCMQWWASRTRKSVGSSPPSFVPPCLSHVELRPFQF